MTSLIEPALAFAEGLALIASPCILPVLPLVLSASVDGGRKRPFGIIIGFVLAFSIFALASRKLVNALGIEPQTVQNVSLVLLAVFGLVLLSEKLSQRFSSLTQGAANFGGKFSANNEGGLCSGILIGALIGLIWTPCAGPILAAVLVQVIRQETDLKSLIIVVPFTIGAGVPMLIIALTGRRLMSKLGFFTKHAEIVRKVFGVVILLAVAFIASGANAGSFFSKAVPAPLAQVGFMLQDGLDKPYPAPALASSQWVNSPPLKLADLKGKVVLIDFWTYSCINCVRTLPHITEWDRKYRDKGLVIIGVHAPEFEFEKQEANVNAAIIAHNIQYPVVMDNHLDTWQNFQNHYWPAHYLIDKTGQVVYTHFGEGKYDITENNIRFLLGLDQTAAADKNDQGQGSTQTPETYLGYDRAEHYAGSNVTQDQPVTYDFPPQLEADHWALQGKWQVGQQNIVTQDKDAALRLNFTARKVFLVLGNANGAPVKVDILLNGQPVGANAGHDVHGNQLNVDGHTLYELIDQKKSQSGLLEIRAQSSGLEAYVFTFGG